MSAYSAKAQPYLDAIAVSVFASQAVRDWLISGTAIEAQYIGAGVLFEEQQAKRWSKKQTAQPFWANYFYGRDARCTCRIEGSRGLEKSLSAMVNRRPTRYAPPASPRHIKSAQR